MVPLIGRTDNQLPPLTVAADAVKLTLPPVLVTESDWAAGLDPPAWPLKVRADGATLRTGCEETVKVTGKLMEVAPVAPIAMEPLLGPSGKPESADDTRETVKVAGVVVVFRLTESHGVDVVAVNPANGEDPVVPMDTAWEPGTVPLTV